MPSLLGLKFLKSKKHSSPPQQQIITEENASNSGYGEQTLAVKKISKAKKLETHHKLKAKATPDDGYGASSRQEITPAHVKPPKKKGLPSDQQPVTRKNFSALKNSQPDEMFTNNEMLPGMERAYKQFRRLYPEYLNTQIIDNIRAREYAYLDESGRVCLDYSGYGLFSNWQETWHKASSSFGLSYISVNLPTHALYGGADEGTAEYDIKKMVSEFLNIQESEYAMVFTASRGSAFKLLGESYPFHISKKLLSVYDYESDAVKWIEEAAQKRGAEVMNAKFRWPSQRLWATNLKKKIVDKQKPKKEPAKGLFVFPVQSRVTGAKYSYQWMSQAQENGWDVLLDASALGPNAMGSLGLCVFRPDFIVSSFFKVYGSDPTGFGCLMIKRSVLQRLHSSSAARGVGMVRLVPTSLCSEGQPKGGGLQVPVHGSVRYTEQRQTSSSRTSAGPSQQFCMARAYSSPSRFLPESSGKPARAGDDEISPSKSYKPSPFHPKVHRDMGNEISTSTFEKLARAGDDEISPSKSYKHSPLHPKVHRDMGSEASTSTFEESARAGDEEISPSKSYKHSPLHPKVHRDLGSEASTSTFEDSASEGVQSLSRNDSLESCLSLTKAQQKLVSSLDEVKEVHSSDDGEKVAELESAYDVGQNDDGQREGQSNPEEGRVSADSGVVGYETSRRGTLQSDPRPHVFMSPTTANGHKDLFFDYSEDASLAAFYDDEDCKNAGLPFYIDDDDDDAKTFNVERKEDEIVCRGLEHAQKLGLTGTNTRLRCLINWLIASMLKLRHPGSPDAYRLVQIYGPKVSYDRGASVAFNLFDWKGNLLQPLLVQRLADRSNISLGITNLSHIQVPKSSSSSSKYLDHLDKVNVSRGHLNSINVSRRHAGEARHVGTVTSIEVITISLCFLSNFHDIYRFWVFLANFLDADFVSKELWLYRSLNQETVMMGAKEPSKSSSF